MRTKKIMSPETVRLKELRAEAKAIKLKINLERTETLVNESYDKAKCCAYIMGQVFDLTKEQALHIVKILKGLK